MKLSIILIIIISYIYICLIPSQIKAENRDDNKEIAVVVNPQNPIKHLTAREVSDIFLSRRRTFPSGEPALVLEQNLDGYLREKFFHLLNGMTLKRLNAYWVRLQFSGEVQPPPVIADNIAMRNVVSNNRYAIGYMDYQYVDQSVSVILILTD